jgi:predicted AlkP superfamily pyrophosphatase or phosphodiesterase
MREHQPSLSLVYLPHLDYNLQRLGPTDPNIVNDISAVDAEAGKIIDLAKEQGADVVVLSEYAITAVDNPIHINRILRHHGFLQVRQECTGWETLDGGASRAFAVADHQIAHMYIRDSCDIPRLETLLRETKGIDQVLNRDMQKILGIDHQRAGDLILVAEQGCWFTYYFWFDDIRAPDYARTVDIHRKPGYDPAELFVDPKIRFPGFRIARRLIQKNLGMRYLMDVIGLDATVVKGSHGRLSESGREESDAPVFISSSRAIEQDKMAVIDVKEAILRLQFEFS